MEEVLKALQPCEGLGTEQTRPGGQEEPGLIRETGGWSAVSSQITQGRVQICYPKADEKL